MRFSFAGRVDRSIFADPFVERTYTSADVAQEEVRGVHLYIYYTNAPLFEWFLSVCPEPVLVKTIILV
jgi:hypothetical protein